MVLLYINRICTDHGLPSHQYYAYNNNKGSTAMTIYQSILKSKPHNKRELERYIKFIDFCETYNKSLDPETKFVKHHICPKDKEMFPEYKCFKTYPWNCIYLTERAHFIAHMMLWHAYRNRSMTYAANMLSNFLGTRYTSRLYAKHREDFRIFTSENNSGRQKTEQERETISKNMKNSIVVYDKRDPEKKKFRIWKNDPLYDEKNHIFFRTGAKHTQETKDKMGRPGTSAYHNPKTREVKYLYKDQIIPEDFINGFPPGYITADHVKETVWCYNKETGKHVRVLEADVPDGFEIGRNMETNPGFDKANSMTNIIDLERRIATKVFSVDKSKHAPQSGMNTSKTLVFLFSGKIFTSKKTFLDYSHKMKYYFQWNRNELTLENKKVKLPHHNCKSEVNDFRKKYKGMTYADLGLEIYHLPNFNLDEHKEKEIYWNE